MKPAHNQNGIDSNADSAPAHVLRAVLLLLIAVLIPTLHGAETQRVYLSGHGKDDAVPWKFMCTTGTNSGYWTNIAVPSNWEMQGFGSLNYRKDPTNAFAERGLYEHEFFAAPEWQSKRVFLVFEGAMTDTSAKVNGQSVGPKHRGGFYRFEYEITSLLKAGASNRLEVEVAKHSANESVNTAERTADFWVFGGIYRPVYLEVVPKHYIDRVAINARADGFFTADVFADATPGDQIEVQLQAADGSRAGAVMQDKAANGPVTLSTRVLAPTTWTAEDPYLYTAVLRLKQNGAVVHELKQRFGFRTFEVRDGDGLYLNGKRIVLKGVNRHSFWPDSGRCLSDAVHQLDIEAMKDANINAVRMSHYPPDQAFLDLCDELGIYVLDELAGWHQNYDDDVGPRLVREMVIRDVNHPSILFWDNGNEGGFNTNLDHLFLQYDPQKRRVLHPWTTFSEVNTTHYQDYDLAVQSCEGWFHESGMKIPGYTRVNTNDSRKYIYMPTEFQHGLYDGGAGAGMEDYWKLMTGSPYLGGGFVWAFADEGMKRADGSIDLAGNQAPDGITGPYRQREASFYTIKELWSPIQVRQTKKGQHTFIVENHYSFTDARQCRFIWGRMGDGTNHHWFATNAVSIPPGGSGKIEYPGPIRDAQNSPVVLRVEDPKGRELWTWAWEFDSRPYLSWARAAGQNEVVVRENERTIVTTCGKLTLIIDKQTGMLVGVNADGKVFSLSKGPVLTGQTNASSLEKLSVTTNETGCVIAAAYSGDLKSVSWHVKNNGWVDCDFSYSAKGTNEFLGVTFDYPEKLVKSKRWLGDGPYRVWKNRQRGITFGIWENAYNDTITGYRDWIYPEFKGFFRDVRWLQLTTAEGEITVVPRNIPYLQVLTPAFPPAEKFGSDLLYGKAFANVPACGLGFMQTIPPIGSKFKVASKMGPQSQLNEVDGEFSGSVSFYFGKFQQ